MRDRERGESGRPTLFQVLIASARRDRRRPGAPIIGALLLHGVALGVLLWATTRPKPLALIERGDFFVIRLPEEPPAPTRELVSPGSGGPGGEAAPVDPGEAGERPPDRPPEVKHAPVTSAALEAIEAAPVFTPFSVAPRLVNRGDIVLELQRAYPPELQQGGVGGRVLLWFLIDELGDVRRLVLKESSGVARLDSAATAVGQRMRFSPALNNGRPAPVWVALPVEFRAQTDSTSEEQLSHSPFRSYNVSKVPVSRFLRTSSQGKQRPFIAT